MKMDAIIKPAPQKGLELVRKDVPVLSDGDALVKIHKTAICGTDVHIYNWDEWSQNTIKPPMTIGHEFVGEIVEMKGAHNKAFKVGDLVSAEGHVVCGSPLPRRTQTSLSQHNGHRRQPRRNFCRICVNSYKQPVALRQINRRKNVRNLRPLRQRHSYRAVL